MQIQIHAKNVEVSGRLRDYAEKKLTHLEKYLPNIARIDLELAQERQKQGGERAVAQVTLRHSRGMILRAEDKSQADMFAAIDLVMEKLNRQIGRYKGKRRRRAADRSEMIDVELIDAEALPEEAEVVEILPTIARRKQIEVSPMSEQEAMDQMELLGHSFFVFFNAETQEFNVLYRRDEGDMGVIIPIYGR
ncbi:MAG TPA: ribosome-associated translation inhibitor RaiA [Aggregatilineales bacterium]|nr:ribosome-associated translation inhibitor RaiA [Anaerolineales bacterium]HRE47069.1 ribosome-associated translation inhibitor RaiA [Aggregatilineales bacterium]